MTHIWTTKKGEKIPINEMTDLHLDNAIQYLKNRAEEYEYEGGSLYGYSGSGEMASYYATQGADDCMDAAARCHRVVHILEAERERRKKEKT